MNETIFFEGALVDGALEALADQAGQACGKSVRKGQAGPAEKALQLRQSAERAQKLKSETGVLESDGGLGKDSTLGSIIIYAARYAMGRQSYAVGEVTRWLEAHWDLLGGAVKQQIQEDIRERLGDERHMEAIRPEEPARSGPLGQDADRERWLAILDLPTGKQ
jgi:hypothetical protein